MFQGFAHDRIDLGDVTLNTRHANGPGVPILLLHGHPRTHATWAHVAPTLAASHPVVCPDLRGYGRSSKPATTEDHTPYSKRTMANDCVRLMSALGHEHFCVVGHDRGGYVAFRAAMDYPDRVTALVALDVIPIGDALARCNAEFAQEWWHWFFFAQPDIPEQVISADPERWYTANAAAVGRARGAELMGPDAYADYLHAINDPETVHAMLEDYRAGLGVDRADDDTDRAAGRGLTCPVCVHWAARDDLGDLYGDPLEIWRSWSSDVRGGPIDSGHHMAEEAPQTLAASILDFVEVAFQ